MGRKKTLSADPRSLYQTQSVPRRAAEPPAEPVALPIEASVEPPVEVPSTTPSKPVETHWKSTAQETDGAEDAVGAHPTTSLATLHADVRPDEFDLRGVMMSMDAPDASVNKVAYRVAYL